MTAAVPVQHYVVFSRWEEEIGGFESRAAEEGDVFWQRREGRTILPINDLRRDVRILAQTFEMGLNSTSRCHRMKATDFVFVSVGQRGIQGAT